MSTEQEMATQRGSGIAVTADYIRVYAKSLHHSLLAPHELTKEEQLALERLVFEMDRLADRCEELHTKQGK